MTYPIRPLRRALWRMLAIRYQHEPFSGGGVRLHGGRWNPPTAIAEFYQGLARPGTLAPYRLDAMVITDLTDGWGGSYDDNVAQAVATPWKRIAKVEGGLPPSWALADKLITDGVQGS